MKDLIYKEGKRMMTLIAMGSLAFGIFTGWLLHKSHIRKIWLKKRAHTIDLQNKPYNNVIRLSSRKRKAKTKFD